MIDVAHLTRRFGALTAVEDLSFSLEQGEVVGFLGPNGAGKTTAMRVLTGYLPATSAARVLVAGHDVLRESMAVRRRIGYLPESVPLYREMRVGEMMRFQGRLHGLDRRQLRRRVGEVLERVGVADRERQRVGELSRGLKQRVGLAVALLPDPAVLILDEPTSGLDPLQRKEVRALIRELAAEHTVLLSSHILAEVETICPRVIVLRDGRLVADGTQDELVTQLGGGAGHVRFEAVVGDAIAARALITTLPGVARVEPGERLGIHQAFAIHGQGDLREDVGALAMQQGWAVRELSWARPTLEELFARLVLREEPPPAGAAAPAAAAAVAAPDPPATPGLELAPEGAGDPPLGTPGRKKTIYSLNPFDRGAARDFARPVDTDAAPQGGSEAEGEGEECAP